MKGRTASCTATSSVSAGSASSAFSTDCWRESPPVTKRTAPPGCCLRISSVTHSISSDRKASTISVTSGQPRNFRIVCSRIGALSSSMNCLREIPDFSAEGRPMRVPRPAAGTMTTVFMGETRLTGRWRGRSSLFALPLDLAVQLTVRLLVQTFGVEHSVGLLVEPSEDHLPGHGLQHAGNRDVDGLGDQPPRIVYNYHRSVVEISHTLVVFLAFFQDEHAHGLAREHHGLKRVG